MLGDNITEQIIGIYRGWHEYERSHNGPDIIDFNLSSIRTTLPFASRSEILQALKDGYYELGRLRYDHRYDLMREKIWGSMMYLRVLMGEQLNGGLHGYVNDTMGFSLRQFLDEEIAQVRDKIINILAVYGLRYETKHHEAFKRMFCIHAPEKFKGDLLKWQEFTLTKLREKGIPVPADLNVRIESVKVDAYWRNWTSGSLQDGFLLQINIHARHSQAYTTGLPIILCLHEIGGHVVQLAILRDRIKEGLADEVYGLTTVHTPEVFVEEALAQTVADLILDDPQELPNEFWLSRWLTLHHQMVLHNAHLQIYQGKPIEDIACYAANHLPFHGWSWIETQLCDRGTHPLWRTYQLSYAAGQLMILEELKNFTPAQKQDFFLGLYTKPMSARMMQQFAQEIRQTA